MEYGGSSWIRRSVALAGLLMVAACGSSAKKGPVQSQGAAPTTARATSTKGGPLGDPKTIDACSLVNASALKDKGAIQVSQGIVFNTCQVGIKPNGISGLVNVEIDTDQEAGNYDLSKIAAQADVSSDGGLQLIVSRPTPGSSGCNAAVITPDKAMVKITASANNDRASSANFCDLAGSVTHQVAATVNQHKVVHRTWPADSLGNVDMCAVLSKADLTSAVAGVVTNTYASPSQHSCTWGDRQSSSSPHVAMATYLQTSKPSSALGGQMVNIAGRDTLVNSDKGGQGLPASCSAKTAAKTWPDGFGNNASADAADGAKPITVSSTNQLVEEPEVSVYANQPEDQLCQTARTLAAKLWAHVPPAT
jgi:hypothetical protein